MSQQRFLFTRKVKSTRRQSPTETIPLGKMGTAMVKSKPSSPCIEFTSLKGNLSDCAFHPIDLRYCVDYFHFNLYCFDFLFLFCVLNVLLMFLVFCRVILYTLFIGIKKKLSF